MERGERFSLAMSRQEKWALETLAETTGGLSQAALIRQLIRAEARRRKIWPTKVEVRRFGHEHPSTDAVAGKRS